MAFLEHFWDNVTQGELRYKIYTGKYNLNKDRLMVDYVLKLSRQARVLSTPMKESKLVTSLARHFDETIARKLRPAWVKTVEQMTEILHHLEMERKIKKDGKRKTEPDVAERKKTNAKDEVAPNKPGPNESSNYRTNNYRREYDKDTNYKPYREYKNYKGGYYKRRQRPSEDSSSSGEEKDK